MKNETIHLHIPDTEIHLVPGCTIKLGRFDEVRWVVSYGWYSWGGNRKICGWYLTSATDTDLIKPLQYEDLIDIYIIEQQ